MADYRYKGPAYKVSMVVNGVAMSPKDIPANRLEYMMYRYPELKQLFREVKEKEAPEKVTSKGK